MVANILWVVLVVIFLVLITWVGAYSGPIVEMFPGVVSKNLGVISCLAIVRVSNVAGVILCFPLVDFSPIWLPSCDWGISNVAGVIYILLLVDFSLTWGID